MFPHKVQDFIKDLQEKISSGDISQAHSLYERNFNELTESYFKNESWPPVEDISSLIQPDDELFRLLYSELYYRHMFVRLQPSVYNRIESFQNYFALFDFILNETDNTFDIPNQWLWDITDEFLYQFQAFSQYRISKKGKKEEEIAFLKEHSDVNVGKVFQYLELLVEKSGITDVLKEARDHSTKIALGTGLTHVRTVLGYFALIGQLRLYSLLGDYHTALKVVEPIDIGSKSLHSRVPAALLTLHYYVGFAFIMMRRYMDAIKTTSMALSLFSKSRVSTRSYQYSNINKMLEQVNGLLSICIVLCPQRLDESVHNTLREKYLEKISRMHRKEEAAFEEVFTFSCPKFIVPVVPAYSDADIGSHDALNQQKAVFMTEVQQQLKLLNVRSFLKLYSTISIVKLSKLLDTTPEETRKLLMLLKHKSHQRSAENVGSLTGNWTSSSEVAFYLEGDVVHLTDVQRHEKNYGDYFVRQISRLEDGITELKQL